MNDTNSSHARLHRTARRVWQAEALARCIAIVDDSGHQQYANVSAALDGLADYLNEIAEDIEAADDANAAEVIDK